MQHKVDFLIIGSGIAGLSYALKVADHGTVAILTKTKIEETATRYAQGGIASVTNEPDSFEKHIRDTISAGADLCNEKIVRKVVTEAPKQIKELIKWGSQFDKDKKGDYDLAKEGGHTEHRILHHKDNTGFEIQRALSEKAKTHPNIKFFKDYFTIDIITQHHLGIEIIRKSKNVECFGIYALNTKKNEVDTFLSRKTLMATGGIGTVYQVTTNPAISTGDGIAMVYRAKGMIENMEFVQFHPTSLYEPGVNPSFLVTEAMRGYGAILKTQNAKDFMHKYDKRESLAPRDIVARAIDNELKNKGEDYVYLDGRHLDPEEYKAHFPNIYAKCLTMGIDITKDMIPVTPAAHYVCGGIKVDEYGRTTIKNLYAAGENASTGMHGANRLASNSLIEAIVFADAAAKSSIKTLNDSDYKDEIPYWDHEGTSLTEEMILITQSLKEVRQVMTSYVGIVRSNLRLKRALDRLEIIYRETEDLYKRSTLSVRICELRNTINIAYLIIKMAMQRKESRGLHYNIDYPTKMEL